MRVVIWGGMEGIAGIETWGQVNGGSPQHEDGRRLMTSEVNAAVRGAKAAGAADVLGHPWCRYVEPLRQGVGCYPAK